MDSKNRSSTRERPPSESPADRLAPPWGRVRLPEDATVHRTVGPMELWLRRIEGEIRLASSPVIAKDPSEAERPSASGSTTDHTQAQAAPPPEEPGEPEARGADPEPTEDPGPPAAPPDDLHQTDETPPGTAAWSRWAPHGEVEEALLQPVLPDRILVVQPDVPFTLLPGAEARIFTRVPLVARVQIPGPSGPVTLREIPTIILSDTWWGDFMEGELAFWLNTTARRVLRPGLLEPHLTVCPLQLINQSAGELKVEKLALRLSHLSLFTGAPGTGGFWTDTSRVRYQGDSETSQVDMTGKPPAEAGEGELVTPPREPFQKGIRARTFARLRSFPGVGSGL